MSTRPRLRPTLRIVVPLASTALLACACGATGSGQAGAGTGQSAASSPSSVASSAASSAATGTTTGASPTAPGATPVPVEQNPPGDIPDNLAFVRYSSPGGGFAFTHPEGWARTGSSTQVRFTDKLNGVTVEGLSATQAPTVASARSTDVARLQASVPAFELRRIEAVRLPGGPAVHLVFRRNSAPDPVTGKVYRDEVEEYELFRAGRLVRMDLFGPVGADNVDAYRTMAQSLVLR